MWVLVQRPGFRLLIVGLVVLTIQTTLFVDLRPFGVIVDLLAGFSVATAVAAGPEAGVLAAFIFGLMIDLLLTTPFGLSALCYGLAAFLIGLLKGSITVNQGWWLSLMLVAIGTALAVGMYAVIGTLVGQHGWIRPKLITEVAVSAVVGGMLSPVSIRTQRWAMKVERQQ